MVKISLPNPNDYSGSGSSLEETGQGMKSFLRQMELSVHHAQKSLEQLESDGMISEESFITFRHPRMELYDREQDDKGYVKVHVDEEGDGMNDIEIEIVT